MKRWLLLGLVLVLSVCSVFAQSTETPVSREDVVKLFDTMKIHEQMRLVMDSLMKQQRR